MDDDRKLIKPKTGLIIRDPKTSEIIPAEGKLVKVKEPYWFRRLQCGDVVLVSINKPFQDKKSGGSK